MPDGLNAKTARSRLIGGMKIAALCAQRSLPALFSTREYSAAGGLMSYGADRIDLGRNARAPLAWGSGICSADALPIGGLPRPQARGELSRGVWVIYFHVDLAVAPGDRNERRSVDTLANGVAVAQGPQGADHRLQ